MKEVVIVCAGENFSVEKLRRYSAGAGFIIAVDGGLKILNEAGIAPSLIIGDFDSVDSKLVDMYPDVPKKAFPPDKDFTDSELAIAEARTLNPDKIYMFASTGSYVDHSLANIFLLKKYEELNISIITDNSEITLINKGITINKVKNRRFSLFPLGKIINIFIKGSRYNYAQSNLDVSDQSVSNVAVEDKLEITFDSGEILMVLFDPNYI
ncbi:MAG TPA: thiamine diphosphokinase [Spirochaetota bacterium]|jgi:thiamine pyrophosphokinase|nr:MAG: Thiamine pyrophosphokinase [Spirochaetes bacterium ADurb.Bin133]HNZ26120.1 thiamine diphosphokinase [Spirochaetota bacterium]HPY86563.1 thiamine diphosphokinase [Spirochaetota bacterium]HQB60831.1 thiamine diphosphokinase [Spirochaetota bacterium]